MSMINFVRNNVGTKWAHYKQYLDPIFSRVFLLTKTKKRGSSASVILIQDDQCQQMNKTYRHKDYPTDVLTFIDDAEEGYLGDIFINVDALERQAKSYGHSKKREFCFLVAHGALHLLGYDHQTKEEETEMFSLQEEVLSEIAPRKKV